MKMGLNEEFYEASCLCLKSLNLLSQEFYYKYKRMGERTQETPGCSFKQNLRSKVSFYQHHKFSSCHQGRPFGCSSPVPAEFWRPFCAFTFRFAREERLMDPPLE